MRRVDRRRLRELRLSALVLALSLAAVGCGGECIPKTATSPASFTMAGPTTESVAVTHSADELRAVIANIPMAPSPPSPIVGEPADATESAKAMRDSVEAFVSATTFTTSDVAVVRAGVDRMRLAGMATNGNDTTIYFTGACSPCGGGNPGSYQEALAADQAARADHTELVRVPKNSRVSIRVCSTSCPACGRDIP